LKIGEVDFVTYRSDLNDTMFGSGLGIWIESIRHPLIGATMPRYPSLPVFPFRPWIYGGLTDHFNRLASI